MRTLPHPAAEAAHAIARHSGRIAPLTAAPDAPQRRTLASAAVSTIQGAQDAHRLAVAIRDGSAPADALHEGLAQIRATGDIDRERGFLRALQKALERHA